MTQRALKLALEALERFEGNKKLWPEAITAIKEALAQTQEPDDIASILACRDMLDAQPVPEADRVIWPERTEQPPQRKPLTDDLYNELLFAVGNKCPNETRHQTALRYILQAEKGDEKAAHGIKENT